MNLIAIGLSILVSSAQFEAIGDTPSQMRTIQDEPRYAIGAMFFAGSSDALTKLKDFARKKGFVLTIVTLPDGSQRLPVTSDLLSDKAFLDIFHEAQSGRLGKLNFAIVSGPPPAPAP